MAAAIVHWCSTALQFHFCCPIRMYTVHNTPLDPSTPQCFTAHVPTPYTHYACLYSPILTTHASTDLYSLRMPLLPMLTAHASTPYTHYACLYSPMLTAHASTPLYSLRMPLILYTHYACLYSPILTTQRSDATNL